MSSKIKDRIRAALVSGVKLTQADANKLPYCTSRLGAYVHTLRKEGLPVITEIIEVKCADGHIAHVAQYSIKKETLF